MVSDPIDFDLAPLSDLAVTIRVKDPTNAVTGHPGARCTSYLQAGDAVAEPDLPRAARTPHWYYLCGVDVEAADAEPPPWRCSATRSPTAGARRPTATAAGPTTSPAACTRASGTARVGVLNQGLGGNRLLNDGLGPNALARLDRDVLAQPGVRWLIVLEGINDLGTRSATARDLIGAYEQIILRAHARGIKVYGATILPCEGSSYFNPELEAARQEVNAWIRESGRFDAVIDLDAATRDPQKPSRLSAAVGRRRPPAPGPGRVQDHGRVGRPDPVCKVTGPFVDERIS